MSRILTPQQKIERSIVTDFRRDIWNKFVMGYERYDMIKPGDKIAVCISGGKDSMLLAKCMQHLQKYQGMDIGLEFIVMNPGYSDANRQRIIDNAALMGIPIKMFETKVFDIAYKTQPMLSLCKNETWLALQICAGSWVQQDSFGTSF